jgi:glycosyltransferase involved in cell wall biosynthesis
LRAGEKGDQIKVTVGVCARNGASTLPQVMESIMKQDFPHKLMEVVFVDDGSEDDSLRIVEGYASKTDMSVRIFHHEWKGLGPSRNVVVDNARGGYIVWVDADMIIPKDHVRKQVEFLQNKPEVGIGKARCGLSPEQSVVSFLELVPFAVYDSRNGSLDSRLPGSAGAIYRVDAIRGVGGFDSTIIRGGEDIDAARRIRATGWLLCRSPTVFYEKARQTWQALWNQYSQRGHALFYLYYKNRITLSVYRMNPIAGFLSGVSYVVDAYRITGNRVVFLLPFHFAFKMTAWCVGFSKRSL